VRLVGPESVAEAYKEHLKKIIEEY